MRRLLDEVALRYTDRVVLFDSPPLLATSEASVLAEQMGQICVVVESAVGDGPELWHAIDDLEADGSTDIYEGLRTAYEVVEAHAAPGLQNRVMLLSDGESQAIEMRDQPALRDTRVGREHEGLRRPG